jgi:hypothetical protein
MPVATSDPSPKRRWWPRYSLRTFLVAMLLVGVGLGCLGIYWNRLRRQRQIVAKIEAADGEVLYDYQFGAASDRRIVDPYEDAVDALMTSMSKTHDGRRTRIRTTLTESLVEVETPPGPKLIRRMIGDDAFANVENVSFFDWDSQPPGKLDPQLLLELPQLKCVDLVDRQVNDEWLRQVAKVPQLRIANLFGDKDGTASAKGLASFESARQLEDLSIAGEWLQDDTVKGIAGLRQLRSLTIASAPSVTSAVFSNLDQLTELRELAILRAEKVNDQGTETLRGLRQLRQLMLFHTSISDDCLAHLRELKHLEALNVSWTNVGDTGLESLKGLSNLKYLDVQGTRVGDSGMVHLAGLLELKHLTLRGTQVGDAGMQTISRLPRLRYLSAGPLVTDAALPAIGRMTQLEVLELYPSKITDAGLVHLQTLKNLRRLHIGPHVTPAAADALRKVLPECDVIPFDNAGHSL